MTRRRLVLGGTLVLLSLVAAALLAEVLGTVFFAVTVAYLLLPLRRRLTDRGLPPWWASAVATLAAVLGALAVLSPIAIVLFVRRDALIDLLNAVPARIALEFLGYTYALTLEEAMAFAIAYTRTLAREVLTALPVFLIKLTLFVLLLFSVLCNDFSARQALLAVVPAEYRDVARALDRRTRETLFAIYVLQAATAVATFLIAMPVFFALGYGNFVALAAVCAVLQFVPIVGPIFLIGTISLYQIAVGNVTDGVLLFLLGGAFVAWLPDVLVRPRLARQTADLSGGLYFVGFVGGLLTLGPVGIVAGPLVVALVAETIDIATTELNGVEVRDG